MKIDMFNSKNTNTDNEEKNTGDEDEKNLCLSMVDLYLHIVAHI